MNIEKTADELYKLKKDCDWELITDIGKTALIDIRSEIDKLALSLSKEGIDLDQKSRIKSFESVLAKLESKGLEPTFDNIMKNIHDIAAARIIVTTEDDCYMIRDLLASSLTIVEERDYIKNPKENGYRSLHLIIELHVRFNGTKYSTKAELQIRTHGQNYWSILEHDLGYKNDLQTEDSVQYFKSLSDTLHKVDTAYSKAKKKAKEQKK